MSEQPSVDFGDEFPDLEAGVEVDDDGLLDEKDDWELTDDLETETYPGGEN